MKNYTAVSLLGEGSFGKVMKCSSKLSGGLCAIKRFYDTETEGVKYIIERELSPLLKLKHDNIVQLLDMFTEKGVLHGVFELLHHSILNEVRALAQPGQGLDCITLRKYIFQLLRGVAFLHSSNFIHRDIKPDNLLVSGSGVVKLADMGLNREVGDTAAPLTGGLGTLAYMAPELLLRDRNYGKAVDVWAIGCTIVDMDNGIGPNTEICSTFLEQLQEIVTNVGPLTQLQTQQYMANADFASVELPKAQLPATPMDKFMIFNRPLAELVDSCLQMDPASRPSCSEMLGHEYFSTDQFNESFTKELGDMVAKDQLDPNCHTVLSLRKELEVMKEMKQHRLQEQTQQAAGPPGALGPRDSPPLACVEIGVNDGVEEVEDQVLCYSPSQDAPSSQPSGWNEEERVEVNQEKKKSFQKAFSRAVQTIGPFFTCCVSPVNDQWDNVQSVELADISI